MIETSIIETLLWKIMLHLFLLYKKINGTLTDNTEDFDVVMPMYNLIEYSKNYLKTSGSLWNFYKDIPIDSITNSESKY